MNSVFKINLPHTNADDGMEIIPQDTTISSCDGSTSNHKKTTNKRVLLYSFLQCISFMYIHGRN